MMGPLSGTLYPQTRVSPPQRLRTALRALILRAHRIKMARAEHLSPEEIEWLVRVEAVVRQLADEGDAVLLDRPEPIRIAKRARKRTAV